ncbi:MAG: FAD-dependent oxidoreductase [Elusimicrobiota bacterium]|jgi:glycerol-3-phosphate dehydrogenase
MEHFDALIIGGGITGAGTARDLALRGLKVLLAERDVPGSGTTSASTHLIHGGLRYLLYDRPTTLSTCWDSGHIVRASRRLLRRLPVLWPVYRGQLRGFATVETLLESYDGLSSMKYGRPHLRLSAQTVSRLVPGLKTEGLLGGLVFDEWWVPAVRLVEENLASAHRAGAQVRLKTEVLSLWKEEGRVLGAVLRGPDGKEERVQADITVNAAGPWVGQIARMAGCEIPMRLRKGTHLIYPGQWASLTASRVPLGLLLEAVDRQRYVFIIPGDGRTLVGPTDLDGGQDPDKTASTAEEISYLQASARRYFSNIPERFERAVCGARPILGRGPEKLLSREFEILDHSRRDGIPGFVSAAGGKMSDFRLMGEDAGEAVRRLLGRGGPCRSHLEDLSGNPITEIPPHPRPRIPFFLRRAPRLRELHALAYLGAGLGLHLLKAARGQIRESSYEDFERNYT